MSGYQMGVYNPPKNSHYYQIDVSEMQENVIKISMGKHGKVFKAITHQSGVYYIWHNFEKKMIEVWGPEKCIADAVKRINERISKIVEKINCGQIKLIYRDNNNEKDKRKKTGKKDDEKVPVVYPVKVEVPKSPSPLPFVTSPTPSIPTVIAPIANMLNAPNVPGFVPVVTYVPQSQTQPLIPKFVQPNFVLQQNNTTMPVVKPMSFPELKETIMKKPSKSSSKIINNLEDKENMGNSVIVEDNLDMKLG